ETCMAPTGLKHTTVEIAGADPACPDFGKAVGFTVSAALDNATGERFSTPLLMLVAPSSYHGKTRIVRNNREVYDLTPEQAVQVIVGHEGFHALNRLLGVPSSALEEQVAQEVEETFTHEQILIPTRTLPQLVTYKN